MPGIDFAELRRRVTLTQVLERVGFRPVSRRGDQLRGPCPLHGSTARRSRSLAVHVGKQCWYCFHCHRGGNALDLYLAVTGLRVHEGALRLCTTLNLEVPWLKRVRQPP